MFLFSSVEVDFIFALIFSLFIYKCFSDFAFPTNAQHLTQVHILDLHEEGVIKPHIDSIRVFAQETIGFLKSQISVLWWRNSRCLPSFVVCNATSAQGQHGWTHRGSVPEKEESVQAEAWFLLQILKEGRLSKISLILDKYFWNLDNKRYQMGLIWSVHSDTWVDLSSFIIIPLNHVKWANFLFVQYNLFLKPNWVVSFSGIARYDFKHEILDKNESMFDGIEVPRKRLFWFYLFHFFFFKFQANLHNLSRRTEGRKYDEREDRDETARRTRDQLAP